MYSIEHFLSLNLSSPSAIFSRHHLREYKLNKTTRFIDGLSSANSFPFIQGKTFTLWLYNRLDSVYLSRLYGQLRCLRSDTKHNLCDSKTRTFGLYLSRLPTSRCAIFLETLRLRTTLPTAQRSVQKQFNL